MGHSEALAALSDPTRRTLFERLSRRPCSVGELAAKLPISRPAVSQQLKVLKEAGLVVDEAEGTRRIYRIDPHGLGPLRAWLDQFWGGALEAFREETERERKRKAPAAAKAGRGARARRKG